MHTRPCLYCSALIVGWLASSCAWDLATSDADGVVTRCWAGRSPDSGRSIFEPRAPLAISALNATRSAGVNATEAGGKLTLWGHQPNLRAPGEYLRALASKLDVERRIGFGDLGARVWFGLGPPPVRRAA